MRLPRTEAVYFSYGSFVRDSIEKDLRAVGWAQSNVLLMAYYDGRNSSSCASAAWPPGYPGTLGAIYLRGLPNSSNPCANNAFAEFSEQRQFDF